jgi:uncharacterized lipoprotein YddW (UPF0748 family)
MNFEVLMKKWVCIGAVSVLVVWLFFVWLRRPEPDYPEVRAIWVTRFDYRTPADIERIFSTLSAYPFTDVFFQVRGNGTVYWPSKLEPWAQELSGGEMAKLGQDPGWNPLQKAIDEAQRVGLRLHAHVNVLPGWRGLTAPPAGSGQLWEAQRDWFMVDRFATTMLPTKGWYTFLNPALPEVRAHLQALAKELAAYRIDGLHLDYIRYPYDYKYVADEHYPSATREQLRERADFSHDIPTLFRQVIRFGPEATERQLTDFRCKSVTDVVLAMRDGLAGNGSFFYSAAVLGDPEEARRFAYQDSVDWAKNDYLDWVVQMNYNGRTFEANLEKMLSAIGAYRFARQLVMGINCENEAEMVISHIQRSRAAGARGIALLSYSSLFDRKGATDKGRAILESL